MSSKSVKKNKIWGIDFTINTGKQGKTDRMQMAEARYVKVNTKYFIDGWPSW